MEVGGFNQPKNPPKAQSEYSQENRDTEVTSALPGSYIQISPSPNRKYTRFYLIVSPKKDAWLLQFP